MDREVVEQKLESLRHCVRRIEAKCPEDALTLVADPDLQDILSLNLGRAFADFAREVSLRCT